MYFKPTYMQLKDIFEKKISELTVRELSSLFDFIYAKRNVRSEDWITTKEACDITMYSRRWLIEKYLLPGRVESYKTGSQKKGEWMINRESLIKVINEELEKKRP